MKKVTVNISELNLKRAKHRAKETNVTAEQWLTDMLAYNIQAAFANSNDPTLGGSAGQ